MVLFLGKEFSIEGFLLKIGGVDPACVQFFAFDVAVIKIHMGLVGMWVLVKDLALAFHPGVLLCLQLREHLVFKGGADFSIRRVRCEINQTVGVFFQVV